MKQKNERILYLDVVRVISALLIVFGHYFMTLMQYNINGFPQRLTGFANGSIMAPAITMFFILSGASIVVSQSGKLNIKKFYIQRIRRIFPMFWLAYGIVFIIRFCEFGRLAEVPTWKILFSIVGMDGYFAYLGSNFYILGEWFLGAIIIFYILFPVLKLLLEKCPRLLAITTIVAYVWVNIFNPFQVFLERNIIVCLTACILGMYIGKFVKNINNIVGGMAVIVSVVLIFVPLNNYSVYISNILGVTMYIQFFWLSKFLHIKPIEELCMKFSNMTYEVFLIHHVIIDCYLRRFQNSSFNKTEMIVCTMIMILLVYIGAILLNKLYTYLQNAFRSSYNNI